MSSDLDSHAEFPQSEQLTDLEQITHDLNNQIMVIQGNASLLRMHAAESPELCELAEQIISASQRAAALTKQLSAMTSRPVGSAG